MENLIDKLYQTLNNLEISDDKKEFLKESLKKDMKEQFDLSTLKNKLEILFDYEKKYLELIKEFKEEIKFIYNLQEDLRKERAKFFAEILKEVQTTLKESQVDSKVASRWIEELVNSYTKSLDISESLIEEHTIDTIGKLRDDSKKEIKKSKIQ